MQGYLEIWQGFIPHWNRYYFRIHEQLLLFGPDKEQIEGKVHLKIAQIISKLDDPISLIIHTGTETISIRAYSIDEKVKWYKKLKQVQKQAINLAHNKELFKMKVELSKVNRFKILDDLNTELWKCHAELEQRLEQVIDKVKNIQVMKSIDRLRIQIDQFKYKTSQLLQYIDEEIRDLKFRDQDKSRQYKSNSKKINPKYYQNDYNFHQTVQNEEDTQYYSFSADILQKKQPIKQKSMKRRASEIQQESSSLSSLSINLKQKKTLYETPKPKHKISRNDFDADENIEMNRLKTKILKENKVFLRYSNIISNFEGRESLPQKFTPQQKLPVINTFTSALSSGADLTKLTIPVMMNEPLSILQRNCQQMLYSQLLNRADDSNQEDMRILFVAAFTVAGYSLNQFRTKKPFDSLVGETFEYIDEGKGYEFLSEQVSLNPPISAYYVKSDNYEIFDNTKSKISFTGNGIKTIPESKTIIKLEKNNQLYVISKAEVALTNLLFGRTCIEIYGQITVKCKQFKTQIALQFQQDSFWKGTQALKIVGYLQNNGKKVYNIQGLWNKQLIAENIATKQKIVLWRKSHSVIKDYYNFNELSIQLNNLSANSYKSLPPTDSRFRPDQRALQFRDMDLAAEEKCRLQEKQRNRKSQYKSLWFKESVLQGEGVYISNDKYWDQKIKGNWKESLDIF